MAVKLTDMEDRTKVVPVHWDGEVIDVCYRYNAVTPELLERVDVAAAEDNLDVLEVTWEPILEWWDILVADGSRLPVKGNVKRVPMTFLNALQKAVDDDQSPPDETSSSAS